MARHRNISQDKTSSELAREAFWFLTHTLIAVIFFAIAIGTMSFDNPDPDSSAPKALGTALAFLVPMLGGFLLARIHRNNIAAYVWVAGLIFFSIICVHVLNLPTGTGLCESCGPMEKIGRTFFTFTHGSGLMGGDGLLIGSWIPLSTIGYAIGAKLAIR